MKFCSARSRIYSKLSQTSLMSQPRASRSPNRSLPSALETIQRYRLEYATEPIVYDCFDGQEAMLRSNAWHVQPEHSMGAVVKHGGRGPLSVGQAAAEAAGEAGRRPAMPVVQRERLKSRDGARSTAGVLPSRAAAKGAPSNVYRRSARCLRALAATPKPARALGPSRIALTGASPSVSCRASSVYVPLMWGSLSPGCAPEVALQCRAWSM